MSSKIRILIVLAFILIFSATAYAEAVSSTELIEMADFYDGKKITYRGEAVTQVLSRDSGSWININDGENAIGVWFAGPLKDSVSFLGGYKTRGDMIEVEGIFHRACPEHGGELDIHAASARIVETGYAVAEEVDKGKLGLSIKIFIAVILLAVIFRKRL